MHKSKCSFRNSSTVSAVQTCFLVCYSGFVYLCRRKVCTMLLLMILRASHTSMATMFLVRALEKLSLYTATAPPVSVELVLLVSRSR